MMFSVLRLHTLIFAKWTHLHSMFARQLTLNVGMLIHFVVRGCRSLPHDAGAAIGCKLQLVACRSRSQCELMLACGFVCHLLGYKGKIGRISRRTEHEHNTSCQRPLACLYAKSSFGGQ